MLQVLDGSLWRAYAKEHERRAGRFADPFVRRRERGQAHPVEDFLFTYYTLKPGQFKRWHPGAGVILLDAAERTSWKFYRAATEDELLSAGLSPDDARTHAERGDAVLVDIPQFVDKRGTALTFTREILSNTADKKAFLDALVCTNGLWRINQFRTIFRHDYLDLRLGAEGTTGWLSRTASAVRISMRSGFSCLRRRP